MRLLILPIIFIIFLSATPVEKTDTSPGNSTTPAQPSFQLFKKVSDSYSQSFEIKTLSDEETTNEKKKKKKYDDLDAAPPVLSSEELTRICFEKIFKHSNLALDKEKIYKDILNSYLWKDINLLVGPDSNPSINLISRIDHTETTLGRCCLAGYLVTPTSELSELKNRQEIIKQFINEKEDTEKISKYLKEYSSCENSLLSLWSHADPLYAKDYTRYINKKFYYSKKINNKHAARLELRKRFHSDFLGIQLKAGWPFIGMGAVEIFAIPFMGPDTAKTVRTEAYSTLAPGYNMIDTLVRQIPNEKKLAKLENREPKGFYPQLMSRATLTAIWLGTCWSAYSTYDEYSTVLKSLALRIADLKCMIKNMDYTIKVIDNNPRLKEIYGNKILKIKELINHDKKTDLGKLINHLKTMPLSKRSYFFHNTGKLLASFTLFKEHKKKFSDAMFEFAQLDMYISMAKLLEDNNSVKEGQKYTFSKYIEDKNEDGPEIKIDNMWNPFIDTQKAIPNDIRLGKKFNTRNILLTGPNAGGKSTYISGICISILLSQVFGIAPCQNMTFTPFTRIASYIKISDDISEGKSYFMAEVERAYKLLQSLKTYPKDQYIFSVMDEMFNGTNPRAGSAAAYSIISEIGKFENSLMIIATHFPILMLLEEQEKQGMFKNYKVYIGEKGEFIFKIIPGKADQSNAIDILRDQGFDGSIVDKANDIMQNPGKYKAEFI